MDVYDNLKALGIELPPPPQKGGVYVPVKVFNGNLLYFSGCGPNIGEKKFIGKLGETVSLEEGQLACRNCILNILSAIQAEIKDLNRIKSFVKILVFVASSPDFYSQPAVANGATKLLVDIFGEKIGLPTRSAIATNVLPDNIAVEIEGIVEFA